MSEEEWLKCDEPETLVEFIQPRTTERKSRLLAVACCRNILPMTRHVCCRNAVDIAERFADGTATSEEMHTIHEQVRDIYVSGGPVDRRNANDEPSLESKAWSIATQSTLFLSSLSGDYNYLSNCLQCTYLAARRRAYLTTRPDEAIADYPILVQWQTSAIRDIFGNPFRPATISPAWITSTVQGLAQAIYDGIDFTTLPILADALLDAGCDNEDMLAHCRREGPHVKGCWLIDMLLQKA